MLLCCARPPHSTRSTRARSSIARVGQAGEARFQREEDLAGRGSGVGRGRGGGGVKASWQGGGGVRSASVSGSRQRRWVPRQQRSAGLQVTVTWKCIWPIAAGCGGLTMTKMEKARNIGSVLLGATARRNESAYRICAQAGCVGQRRGVAACTRPAGSWQQVQPCGHSSRWLRQQHAHASVHHQQLSPAAAAQESVHRRRGRQGHPAQASTHQDGQQQGCSQQWARLQHVGEALAPARLRHRPPALQQVEHCRQSAGRQRLSVGCAMCAGSGACLPLSGPNFAMGKGKGCDALVLGRRFSGRSRQALAQHSAAVRCNPQCSCSICYAPALAPELLRSLSSGISPYSSSP